MSDELEAGNRVGFIVVPTGPGVGQFEILRSRREVEKECKDLNARDFATRKPYRVGVVYIENE